MKVHEMMALLSRVQNKNAEVKMVFEDDEGTVAFSVDDALDAEQTTWLAEEFPGEEVVAIGIR